MAKKTCSLVEAAKGLDCSRTGRRTYRELLTPEQRAEFDELLEWFRETRDRPTSKDIRGLLKEKFGRAPSEGTLRNYVNGT